MDPHLFYRPRPAEDAEPAAPPAPVKPAAPPLSESAPASTPPLDPCGPHVLRRISEASGRS